MDYFTSYVAARFLGIRENQRYEVVLNIGPIGGVTAVLWAVRVPNKIKIYWVTY